MRTFKLPPSLFLFASLPAFAAQPTYTTFPAVAVAGVSDALTIAGTQQNLQGFVLPADGAISSFTAPGGIFVLETVPTSVNAAGWVVGYYYAYTAGPAQGGYALQHCLTLGNPRGWKLDRDELHGR